MERYIVDKNSGRLTKIGSRTHKLKLMTKIRGNVKTGIVLTNIDKGGVKTIKKSLPKLDKNQFYYYDSKNKTIVIKNKSLKIDELLIYISKQVPYMIDNFIDDIDDNDDKDTTRQKIRKIFFDSISL